MGLMSIIKEKIFSRKGSYILEAAIFLPILILSISALTLIILITGICENICFSTAEEVLTMSLEAYKYRDSVSLCNKTESRISEENPVDFRITRFKYLYNGSGMTDLIAVEGKADFNVVNAIGIDGRITFEEKLLTRGFTGMLNMGKCLDEDDFHQNKSTYKVVVFPKYGIKYHRKTCRYVTEIYKNEYRQEMEKEDAVRKKYSPCKICGGAANV